MIIQQQHRNWEKDLEIGKKKEEIFKEDFLDYFRIGFVDVSLDKDFQRSGVDLLAQCLNGVDIKSYKDTDYIILEEMSNVEKDKKGWIYTSKANFFSFVSIYSRIMLILKNDDSFKEWWEVNKERFELETNSTQNGNDVWHSQFRRVPLKELNISWYKKNLTSG